MNVADLIGALQGVEPDLQVFNGDSLLATVQVVKWTKEEKKEAGCNLEDRVYLDFED